MLKCDFCSSQPVVATYKANDFVVTVFSIGGLEQESIGCWAACSRCEALIDASDWTGLVKHVADKFIVRYPICSWIRPEVERDFGLMYSQLQANGFTKEVLDH